MSPYRRPAVPDSSATASDDEDGCPDADLLPIFFVLWIGSIARVALGIAHHEAFGTEGALALLAVLVIPHLSTDAIVWGLRRCVVHLTRRR